MELRQIKELMAAMEKTGTQRLLIEQEGKKVEIERPSPQAPIATTVYHPEMIPQKSMKMELPRAEESSAPMPEQPKETGVFITSPMVGTFYSSPSPEEPPFVKEGDRVEKGQVICIIEAMKVMNEVKAEAPGVVTEVLLENGHPVEFGSNLFKIV